MGLFGLKFLVRPLSSVYSSPVPYNEETRMAMDFYDALWWKRDVDKIRELLEAGADPNYCRGERKWLDDNPLDLITRCYSLSIWHDFENDEEFPEIRVLRLLLSHGADIRRRPYVWNRVYLNNNEFVNGRLRDGYWDAAEAIIPPPDDIRDPVTGKNNVEVYQKHRQELRELVNRLEEEDSEREEKFKQYVDAFNRMLKVLLEEGADPDQKGHPYVHTEEAWKAGINDESAKKYYAKGTRAINEAIQKGIRWESQVDLLLQYTKLDEDSLQAAKRSNDPQMVAKIEALWKKQLEGSK